MFDVKLLDGMSFRELGDTLGQVLEKMDEVSAELSEGEDDPRLDMLMVIANQIIVRMDSIIRDYGRSHPEVLDQWNRATDGYEERFKQYARTHLKGGVPVLMVEPESPSQASGADAAWQAKLDEFLLDETKLDGASAGDLFPLLSLVIEKVKQFDEEFEEDISGPIIKKLLNYGDAIVRRLDPLVREDYRDQPDKLAGWEDLMRDYKALADEREESIPADVESPDIPN